MTNLRQILHQLHISAALVRLLFTERDHTQLRGYKTLNLIDQVTTVSSLCSLNTSGDACH